MNDRDLDRQLQALLDDRIGDKRDAGLRAATLDPATRRALGAYKAVYRALREEPASALPDDFAARVAAAAGYAPARTERELAPWLVAAAAGAGAVLLCGASLAALAPRPEALSAAFAGPLGPLTVAAIGAALLDQLLARR
jgi:anti-sigma factor RsiW